MRRAIFDEEHEQLRAAFRQLLDRDVVPHLAEWERAGIVDRDLFRKVGAAGFLGIAVPEEYGGWRRR